MHLFLLLVACAGMFALFPNGFKYLIGTFVGLCGGGLAWAISAMFFSSLVAWPCFGAFLVLGIAGGLAFAARG